MKKNTIAFWIHVSNEFGYGHLYRSIRLAKLLKNRYDVHIISNEHVDCSKMASENGIGVVFATEDQLNNVLLDMQVSLLIIDRLDNSLERIRNIKKCVNYVISLDDCGDGAAEVDALINGIVELPRKHPTNSYQGINYFVYSDEVEFYSDKPQMTLTKKPKILLSFGGSDPNNISELMIPVVKRNKLYDFTLVVGPGYCSFERINELSIGINNLSIAFAAQDLGRLIFESDVCIISGGLTLFECVYLKKKIIVASQVMQQCISAENLKSRADIYNLGVVGKRSKEKLDIIDDLLANRQKQYCDFYPVEMTNGKYAIANIVDKLLGGYV